MINLSNLFLPETSFCTAVLVGLFLSRIELHSVLCSCLFIEMQVSSFVVCHLLQVDPVTSCALTHLAF